LQGDIVIDKLRCDSGNDVLFLPYGGALQPPRSVLIQNSLFESKLNVPVDVSGKKTIIMEARPTGSYSILNTVINNVSIGSAGGVGVSFYAENGGELTIDGSTIVCTTCTGGGNNFLSGAVSARGDGVVVNVTNSHILSGDGSCALTADQGATIVASNSEVSYTSNGTPITCTDSGGTVLVQ
jgi:hypothetical protein